MYNTVEQLIKWHTASTINYLGLGVVVVQLLILIAMVVFILANTKDIWIPWIMGIVSGYKKRRFNLLK